MGVCNFTCKMENRRMVEIIRLFFICRWIYVVGADALGGPGCKMVVLLHCRSHYSLLLTFLRLPLSPTGRGRLRHPAYRVMEYFALFGRRNVLGSTV